MNTMIQNNPLVARLLRWKDDRGALANLRCGLRSQHESFDLRFRRLLACDDRDELCERLVPVALAAQAKGIVVDYDNLFSDLQYFAGAGRDRVRTRWAQAYWGTPESEAQPETQTASPATA